MNIFENPSNPDATPLLIAVRVVKRFLPDWQYQRMTEASNSAEDVAYYIAQFQKVNATIQALPTTYHQAHKGDAAIAYLHYWLGHSHWWITEKDRMGGIQQATGLTLLEGDTGNGTQGYISIAEIVEQGAMLDVRFVPTSLERVKLGLDRLRREPGSLWPKPGEAADSLFQRVVKHMASHPASPYHGEVHHV
jgi:hypothetical protein